MQRLDEYAKVAEAADILGISPNTLRAWAEKGKIPSTTNPVNGYRLFRQADLEEFLQNIKNDLDRSSVRKPVRPK